MTFSEPVMDTENIFTKGSKMFSYVKISFLICHYLFLVTVVTWIIKKQCRAMLLISEYCGVSWMFPWMMYTHLIPLIFRTCKISRSTSPWFVIEWKVSVDKKNLMKGYGMNIILKGFFCILNNGGYSVHYILRL